MNRLNLITLLTACALCACQPGPVEKDQPAETAREAQTAPQGAQDLAGTWIVDRLNDETVVAGDGPSSGGLLPWFRIGNGRISGNLSCNDFSGDVETGAQSIHVGTIVSTKIACGGATTLQETSLRQALIEAGVWHLKEDGNVLLTKDIYTLLKLRRAADDESIYNLLGTWRVTHFDGAPIEAALATSGTEAFTPPGFTVHVGQIGIWSFCNSGEAPLRAKGQTLSIAQVEHTEMDCGELEGRYWNFFERVSRFTVHADGVLELRTPTNDALLAAPA